MATLINQLFSKSQADAIQKLWEDNSLQPLLKKEIGKNS